jgi:homoserine/homoserine lactone efflux protein
MVIMGGPMLSVFSSDWPLLIPFLSATLLLLLTPDAVVTIVVHNTLRSGTTAGVMTAFGVEFGETLVLGAVFAGLAVSQEFLPLFFKWLSLAGIAYLLWRAVLTLWRARRISPERSIKGTSRPLIDGLTIAFSNPTTLVFHTAFFPQFISPQHPFLTQLLLLGAIYISLSLVFDFIFIIAATRLRHIANGGAARFARLGEIGSALIYMCIASFALVGLAKSMT